MYRLCYFKDEIWINFIHFCRRDDLFNQLNYSAHEPLATFVYNLTTSNLESGKRCAQEHSRLKRVQGHVR